MCDRLAAAGISSRDLFPNLARLPVAAPARHACPHAEALAGCGVNLPLYPDMTEADVDAVVRGVCAA